MKELTREQTDLLHAKLVIADLTLELYRLKAELYRLVNLNKEKE